MVQTSCSIRPLTIDRKILLYFIVFLSLNKIPLDIIWVKLDFVPLKIAFIDPSNVQSRVKNN